jgi:hypothetical protein
VDIETMFEDGLEGVALELIMLEKERRKESEMMFF